MTYGERLRPVDIAAYELLEAGSSLTLDNGQFTKGELAMKKNPLVITIGRQSGSGGRYIAQLLADDLGVKCYDRELLTMAAKSSGLCQELFEKHDERPSNSFLYSLVMDSYSMGYSSSAYVDMPINQKIFLAQFETIKKLAEEEPCVIVGRCADYALENHGNIISIYITGDEKDKIERLAKINSLSYDKAREMMIKIDKKRSGYYNYYSNRKWGDARCYDLCVNSSKLGYEGVKELIKAYIDIRA